MTRALLFSLLGACASAGAASGTSELTATPVPAENVTVLAALADATLTAESPVGSGKLLPDAVRAAIGQLVEQVTPDESFAQLRVVCTRFVPCEKALLSDSQCAAQVRFVLQPIRATGADDAAVHVFYELPDGAKPALAEALAAGKVDALATAAQGTLARVTFLRNVDVKGNGWVFGGYDVKDGAFAPLVIPRLAANEQRLVTNGDFPFAISLTPKPTTDPQLGMLLDPVRLGILFDADAASAAGKVTSGNAVAVALEDPAAHDATDTDCGSCHVAGTARKVAATTAAAHAFSLPARADIAGATDTGRRPAEALRACGYVGATPVLSQRTVNETARAAAQWGALAGDHR